MTKKIFDMVDPSSLQEKCDIRISHFRRNNPPPFQWLGGGSISGRPRHDA